MSAAPRCLRALHGRLDAGHLVLCLLPAGHPGRHRGRAQGGYLGGQTWAWSPGDTVVTLDGHGIGLRVPA